MKIGVLTFHWAANHGAVLQTYALQQYLEKNYNLSVEVINYCPDNLEINLKNAIRYVRPKIFFSKLVELKKEKLIAPFRNRIKLTERINTYERIGDLCEKYDILISGSDQVWNPSFLMNGEGKITPTYFLNFTENCSKVSVSASFGCSNISEENASIIVPLLEKFDYISVREKTGATILDALGFRNVDITADPASLLNYNEILELCSSEQTKSFDRVSYFMLRKIDDFAKKTISYFCNANSQKQAINIQYKSVDEWLASIRDSKIVITNSFHCVLMCMKLHTEFAVILENGFLSGMNDRFFSLLSRFDMEDRIIRTEADIEKLKEINFEKVDYQMEQYSSTLKTYLAKVLLDSK